MTTGLSAIFVTHNSEDCIGDALESVRRYLPATELVVVDNDSGDKTRDVVGAFPGARLVTPGGNVGFGRACNIGVDNSTGTHLLFINPDARIVSVDSTALRELLARNPFGLVGPHLGASDAPDAFARGALWPERHWIFAYLGQTVGMLRPRKQPSRPPHTPPAGACWVAASVVLAKRDEFNRLGGFDSRFFMYYEDRELSARYRDAGLPLRSTPAIRVEHRGGASSQTSGFRAVPLGWALLGWIQYLELRHGPRVAGRAARLARATLRAMALGLRLTRVPRATKKGREVGMLLDFVEEVASRPPESSGGFCPEAVRHFARRPVPGRVFRRPDSAH